MISTFRCFALCALLSLIYAAPLAAQQPLQVIIDGPGQSSLGYALAAPLGPTGGQALTGKGAQLNAYIRENLSILPFLNAIEDKAILGGVVLPAYSGPEVDIRRFKLSGADILITAGWPDGDTGEGPFNVELRALDTFSGEQLAARRYTLPRGMDMLGEMADRFCSELLIALVGKGELYQSTLAFVKTTAPEQKNIFIARPGGRGLTQITREKGEALSPAWSADGRYIAFTYIDRRSHSLGLWNAATNSLQKTRFINSTVISPKFLPDNRIAASLSTRGYQDIFLLDSSLNRERALESSSAINVSPSFDASGTKMAFCSNRLGGPQIFLKDLNSGQITRISRSGSYNTSPTISPDGTVVAFTRRTDSGHRIFVYDLTTQAERQISFGPGSDEEPAFAPDGLFVAFTSTRSGSSQIYLTTRYGAQPKRLSTGSGDAGMPAWGMRK